MNSLNNFITEERANRRKDYLSSPTYILEHYNTERQNIEAYNGRQLLEMLQNADDASASAEVKKVCIHLTAKELVISNNGEHFTEDGFRSILYSSVSSKQKQQNKIGHKGLGFRSILSWSDEVIIASGGTAVAFAKNYSAKFLSELVLEDPKISAFLRERTDVENPIATLRIPELIAGDSKKQDYDTTISIKLKDDIIEFVQEQIHKLVTKETLVFLNNIACIEIDSPTRKVTLTKTVDANDGTVSVNVINLADGSEETSTWQIKKSTGQFKGKNFELAVAWNQALDDKENVLFSYFKTEARFPFPALVHGTFELTPDRKHLERDTNGHNRFLTDQLAQLLIETAVAVSNGNPSVSYKPLSLLNIDFDTLDAVLAGYGFKESLIEKLKASALFPTVNGSYITYNEKPVYYDYPIADFCTGEDVNNMMIICDEPDLLAFMRKNQFLHYYLFATFSSLIANRIGVLPLSQIGSLCYVILTYNEYSNQAKSPEFDVKQLSPFLVDEDLKPIDWDANIFLQIDKETSFRLPKFFNIVFIHPELAASILSAFGQTDYKYLLERLHVFGVRDYSFIEVAETMIDHYSDEDESDISTVTELHKHLFRLYKKESREKSVQSLRSVGEVPVLSKNSKVIKAGSVYFGKLYANAIIDKLYGKDRQKFLGAPVLHHLENEDPAIVKKYFAWTGVDSLPRYRSVLLKNTDEDFKPFSEHVLRGYDYKKPIEHGDYYKDYNQLQYDLYSVTSVRVGCFDDIKKILNKASMETVFEWIKCDDRLRKTLEENSETQTDAKIDLNLRGKQYLRHISKGAIRSYTRWLIATTEWLPVESGIRKTAPDKCCTSRTITPDFSPFVEKPKLDIVKFADRLELPETTIENYLSVIGVHREISSFSVGALYDLLTSLPKADSTGRVARKLYREIISNFNENKIDSHHSSYKNFITSGQVYCKKGLSVDYFPVGKSYYTPTKAYGNNVLKFFPLIEIDSKQGSQKIERLFGVKRLRDISFQIIGTPSVHRLNQIFEEEINRFKGLVYVLRKDKDVRHEIANRLKKLRIFIAEGLETKFTHEGQTEDFVLEQFEYIHHTIRNQFYISVPPELESLSELRESNRFCQSIAEIFSIIIETEEYNDFIHDLFARSENGREARLLSYMQKDDNADLIEAKNNLDIIDDVRLSFWKAFALSVKRKSKINIIDERSLSLFLDGNLVLSDEQRSKYLSVDYYEQLNDTETLDDLHTLFVEQGVEMTIFTRHFARLSFTELFRDQFVDCRIKHRNSFAHALYRHLKSALLPLQERFFDAIDDYEYLSYHETDGFISDMERHFLSRVNSAYRLKLTLNAVEFSVDALIAQSIQLLSDQQITAPELLMEQRGFQAILLFGLIDNAIERVRQFNSQPAPATAQGTKQITVRGSTVAFEGYPALAAKALEGLAIDKLPFKVSKTLAADASREGSNGNPRSGGSRRVRFNTGNEEQIGFIAELLCYHRLIERYGLENVNWVSENAARAYPDKFITREAGSGYDMELREDGKTRLIEVKSVSGSEAIYMTREEMRKATEYSGKYDLLIVEDPLTTRPVFRYIRSPFRFKKEETLFSNSKFKVYNETYYLRFSWDES